MAVTDREYHGTQGRPSLSSGSRRGGGPRAVAGAVAKISGPILRRRGFAESRVVTDWADIVGSELARHCVPEKLVYARGKVGAGVLHVRVAGPWAVELQHLEPVVTERINGHFGYRAVDRLRLIQVSAPDRDCRGDGPEASSAQVADRVASASPVPALDAVEDEALAAALADLGEAVRGRAPVGVAGGPKPPSPAGRGS